MWTVIRLVVSVLFVSHFSLTGPALAQDAGAHGSPSEPTRIEADSEQGEIRLYVEGALAAILKEDGLHVRESIGYGGTLTDYGKTGFEDFTIGAGTAPDGEEGGADVE